MVYSYLKNIIPLVLICFFAASSANLPSYSETLLKGYISKILEKGEKLEISLNTPINHYFSLNGDKVFAIISKDIKSENKVLISQGSILSGIITQIKSPGRFGQDGKIEILFSELILPNNISVPINAIVSTDINTTSEKIAKTLVYDSALVTYGALHGAIASLQLGGIPLAIASDGISIFAGAGVGASFGLIGSALRRGKLPSIYHLVPMEVALKSDLFILSELPEFDNNNKEKDYTGFRFKPAIKENEVEISIKEVRKEKNKNFGTYFTVKLTIKNHSNKNLSLADIVLIDENGMKIKPNLFLSGLGSLKTLKSFENIDTILAFTLTNPKQNHELAVIDPMDNKEILRVPLK